MTGPLITTSLLNIERTSKAMTLKTVIALLLLAASSVLGERARAQTPKPLAPCQVVNFESQSFTICDVDLKRAQIKLYWKQPDGEPYAYLSKVPQTLVALQAEPAERGRLEFATNAGMYQADLSPVGLFIEGRRQWVGANTRNGPGNFHLKPNGVFYVAGDTAGVLETSTFLRAKIAADLATQSGPMLVINGRLHPKFHASGPSLKIRSGVGVRDGSNVVFAISSDGVSFGTFARLFRDELKTPNALYLDGSISSLYQAATRNGDNLIPLGPMLAVYDKPVEREAGRPSK